MQSRIFIMHHSSLQCHMILQKSLGLFDFMRRRNDRLPPDKSNVFWLENVSDFGAATALGSHVPSKYRESKTRPAAEVRRCSCSTSAVRVLNGRVHANASSLL